MIENLPHGRDEKQIHQSNTLQIHRPQPGLQSYSQALGAPISASAPLEKRILTLRGEKVILDMDLAEVYGVTTKTLNQAIKRNADRFPNDFAFFLTDGEKAKVVTYCDHLA